MDEKNKIDEFNSLINEKRGNLIKLVELEEELNKIRKRNSALDKKIWKLCQHEWRVYDGYNGYDSPKQVCSKCMLFNKYYFYS